jgi:hypothetical protein
MTDELALYGEDAWSDRGERSQQRTSSNAASTFRALANRCCRQRVDLRPHLVPVRPPDVAFVQSIATSQILRAITFLELRHSIESQAPPGRRIVSLPEANGDPLSEITSLLDDGITNPTLSQPAVQPHATLRR